MENAIAIRRGSVPKQARALRPTKRVRTAIDAMIFRGLKRSDAAQEAGLVDHSLREALRRPHVLAYLNSQKEVLRTSAGCAALFQIAELSQNAKGEKIRFEASAYLDSGQLRGRQAVNVHVSQQVVMPGYVLDLQESPEALQRDAERRREMLTIDVVPAGI